MFLAVLFFLCLCVFLSALFTLALFTETNKQAQHWRTRRQDSTLPPLVVPKPSKRAASARSRRPARTSLFTLPLFTPETDSLGRTVAKG